MYFFRQFLTGLLLIAQFLGRCSQHLCGEAACYEAKEEADRRFRDTRGRAFSVCGFFVFAIDVYAYIAYIFLHTVCGYPVDVFSCRFVGINLFLYVFYLLICRCLDVVHIVQK